MDKNGNISELLRFIRENMAYNMLAVQFHGLQELICCFSTHCFLYIGNRALHSSYYTWVSSSFRQEVHIMVKKGRGKGNGERGGDWLGGRSLPREKRFSASVAQSVTNFFQHSTRRNAMFTNKANSESIFPIILACHGWGKKGRNHRVWVE